MSDTGSMRYQLGDAVGGACLGLASFTAIVLDQPGWAAACVVGALVVTIAAPAVRGRGVTLMAVVVAAAVAVCSWDGVRLGSTTLSDLLFPLLFIAACAGWLLAGGRGIWLPRVAGWAALAVGLAAILTALFPPDASYLQSRLYATGALVAVVDGRPSDIGGLIRIAMVLVVIPGVVAWFARTPEDLRLVGQMYVFGAVASAVAAFTDLAGLTDFAVGIRGFVDAAGRESGLTSHPNHLALVSALALPFALLCFRSLVARTALLLILVGAVWVSGSRAGLIAVGVGVAAYLAASGGRRLAVAAAVAATALLAALSDALDATRFAGGVAAASDHYRSVTATQAVADFALSPVSGVGAAVIEEAHNVYWQVLAALGVVGAAAAAAVAVGALRVGWRRRLDPPALAAGIAVATFLVVGLASNALVSRYVAVPFAILAAATRMSRTATVAAAVTAAVTPAEQPSGLVAQRSGAR